MTEVEDPVVTLVRLLKTNMRVVNDDGSLASILVSREWCDRELLKSYDGQVTVGLRQPSTVRPLNLDHSLSQRVLNLKVDCWVVDKEGKQAGSRTRSKLREEILRIIREKRTKPDETRYDFLGVSQQAGTHRAYHAGSAAAPPPTSSGWTELTDAEYAKLWYSDDDRLSKSHNVNAEHAMILLRFKLETSKYDPHETNVKKIVLNFEGYGTAPAGNGVTVVVWNHVTSAWENSVIGTGGADETVTMTLTSNLTDYIDMDSDGVGYIYFLARTTNPSDGATPAVLYCDYAECVLTVEGITHLRFGGYRDVDETSVKPFLWHSEFMVKGWMFENVPET
ncbi:MAG: hypothetical protein ACE5KC_00385 [Candidatus Bathyarchaeia archaeon]